MEHFHRRLTTHCSTSFTVNLNSKFAYSLFLPAALALAQRAFADADIFALAALLILRLAVLTAFNDGFLPFTFAQRDLAAAAIFALTAALIFRLFLGPA